MRPDNLKYRVLWCAALMSLSLPGAAALSSGDMDALRQFAGKLKGEYNRIQNAARKKVSAELGAAGCRDYARQANGRAAEHALLARLSSEIYANALGLQLKAAGVASQGYVNGDGKRVTGYRDPLSEGYAEVHHEALSNTLIVVFRGTRILSLKDILTNLTQFSNVTPERYRWADDLVAQVQADHAGQRILLTGHSLGGGLAMYAGLRQMIETVVFNPAGLSKGVLTEMALTRSQWQAANGKVLAFVARSGESIDQVSALSFAGETVIAGRRYLVDLPPALTPLQQHDISRLAGQMAQAPAEMLTCGNDAGFQRI